MKIKSFIFYPTILIIAVIAILLSKQYQRSIDISQYAQNALSESSQKIIGKIKNTLKIQSFSPDNPALRQAIKDIVTRYQQYSDKITFEFINPDTHPELTQQYAVTAYGELVIHYNDTHLNITQLDEATISNSILQLLSTSESFILALKPDIPTGNNYQYLQQLLKRQGNNFQLIDIAQYPVIPDNTALLIINTNKQKLSRADQNKLTQYLDNGGNLLLQLSTTPNPDFNFLLERFSIQQQSGKLVAKDSDNHIRLTRLPKHEINDVLTAPLAFNGSGAISIKDNTTFSTLLISEENHWLTALDRNKPNLLLGDTPGPHAIAAISNHRPHIAVVANSYFLTDKLITKGDNLRFSLSLIAWLSNNQQSIDIESDNTIKKQLNLTDTDARYITIGFLFIIPLLLLLVGAFVRWKRNK